MKTKIWFLAMILFSVGLQARYYAVKNDSQFVDEINKFEFVIACFLPDAHVDGEIDKQLKKDIHLLQDTVKATCETDPYKKLLKNEVGFVVVDTSRDAMAPLLNKYEISGNDQPQFLLFKHGKVVKSIVGQCARLQGFVSKSDLMEFVGDYFGKDFDEILEKKADEQAKDHELQVAKYQAYASYRYPYGSYAPYNPWGSPGPYIYSGYAQFFPYGYSYNGFAFFIP